MCQQIIEQEESRSNKSHLHIILWPVWDIPMVFGHFLFVVPNQPHSAEVNLEEKEERLQI